MFSAPLSPCILTRMQKHFCNWKKPMHLPVTVTTNVTWCKYLIPPSKSQYTLTSFRVITVHRIYLSRVHYPNLKIFFINWLQAGIFASWKWHTANRGELCAMSDAKLIEVVSILFQWISVIRNNSVRKSQVCRCITRWKTQPSRFNAPPIGKNSSPG